MKLALVSLIAASLVTAAAPSAQAGEEPKVVLTEPGSDTRSLLRLKPNGGQMSMGEAGQADMNSTTAITMTLRSEKKQ